MADWSSSSFKLVLCFAVAGAPSFQCLQAQTPRGADTLSDRAVADTQAVIAQLTTHLKGNPRDGASWSRLGVAAWALQLRAKVAGSRSLDATRMGRMADTALRIAAEMQPTDPVVQLTIADFLLATGVSTSRTAAIGYYRAALAAARASGPDSIHARAALSFGMAAWRRYEPLANRRLSTSISDIGRSLTEAMQPYAKAAQAMEEINAINREAETQMLIAKGSGKASDVSSPALQHALLRAAQDPASSARPFSLNSVRNLIEAQSMPLPANVTGAGELARADSLFDEAYRVQPEVPAIFRAAAMVRCERGDWASLERLARQHIARFPDDGWARLALGLALQRQGNSRAASVAFDTALSKLPYLEQRRLDNPGRVVAPARAQRIDQNWAGAREAYSRMYWGTYDPAWSDGVSERRVEFRARVAFAEFRWTVEEAGLRGADTERGDIHIRYGPPDMVAVFGPNVMENAADVMTYWMYNSGMIFAFTSMSGFSTARIPQADQAMIESVKEMQPARYDNLPSRPVDSIVTRLAQFRAGIDSVEFVVASLAPAAVRSGHIWLLSTQGDISFRDSTTVSRSGVMGWVAGIFTGFEYLMRIESSPSDSQRPARYQKYLRRDSTIVTSGPGMSDVLVAADVAETTTPLKRWRDARPVPSVGAIDRGQKLWLVWENYDLAADNGSVAYDVTVSVRRVRGGAGRIVASVVGALASVARVNVREDQVDVQYTKTASQSSVVVEALAVELGATPAGEYAVTVQVADKFGQRTMTRTVMVTVRE